MFRCCLITIFFLFQGFTTVSNDGADVQNTFRIIVFLAVDCPISQDYIGKLNQLHRSLSAKGIELVGLFPGTETRKELKTFARAYQVQFELAIDQGQAWARKLHAGVTPEAFVIDGQDRVLYQGAIDDWYYDLGHHRQQSVHNYLADAVDALQRGSQPDSIKTTAVGCIITLRN